MKPSDIKEAITLSLVTAEPLLILGAPGIGKTELTWQSSQDYAASLNLVPVKLANGRFTLDGENFDPTTQYGFIELCFTQLEGIDVRGLPGITADGITAWSIPEFLPTAGHGTLFLDELSAARKDVQVALYQLTGSRCIGKYKLPDGWRIVAAGNRTCDRSIANTLSDALRDRFAEVTLEPDNKDFLRWLFSNKALNRDIGLFLAFKADRLHTQAQSQAGQVFATPRSWARLARIWTHLKTASETVKTEIAAGIVGEGVACEFIAYCNMKEMLPDIDSILSDPKNATVPSSPDAQIAVLSALAKEASPQNWQAIWTYAKRLGEEFRVMTVQLALELTTPPGKRASESPLLSAPGFSQTLIEIGSMLDL